MIAATDRNRCEDQAADAAGSCRRIMLVDDHPLVRRGLAKLVSEEKDLVICGEASDAAEALTLLAATHPHLVLMDISLRQSNGVELTKTMLQREPSLPVLIVSMHDEPAYVTRALAAGARGYVVKYEEPETILSAIRRTLDGGRFLSRHIAF